MATYRVDMRILHTSDWHVGRTFHGQDLLSDQEAVLGGLADLVVDERVDVVLVAGDLYDRAVPSAEAVGVCTRVLARIRAAGARIVISSGNHDSAPRMGAFAEFAAAGGLHLCTRIGELHRPVLIEDAYGPVALYGIPYLEPEPARYALEAPEARGQVGVLSEAMRRIRADLAARDGMRSVVLAHAFVTGGAASDSERGGVDRVSVEVFDGVDYVALGHLHGPQALTERLRYSGSPIAYSFSEAAQRKLVWLVELDGNGLADVRRHELPVPRRLATVRGALSELLTAPEHEALVGSYLSVTLTDPVRPLDPMRRLHERFPHAVHLEYQPEGGHPQLHYAEKIRGRNDTEIAAEFLTDCRGCGPSTAERALLETALASVTSAAVEVS